MLTNNPHTRTVEVRVVRGDAERQQVFGLRYRVYQRGMQHLLHRSSARHPAEDQYDASAYLFGGWSGDTLVMSGRLSRPMEGVWEVPELASVMAERSDRGGGALIMSRGVVDPAYRGSGLLVVLLHGVTAWAARHTPYSAGVGMTNPSMQPFYERLGVDLLADMHLPSRQERRYLVFGAELERWASRMGGYARSQGWVLNIDDAGDMLTAIAPLDPGVLPEAQIGTSHRKPEETST